MELSVIICAHNSRLDYLNLVLDGLKAQTLSLERWELILIDNASKRALAEQCDLSWHGNAHCIREEELGLTPARMRGVREAEGDLMIFVDDDNVLAPNYLEAALELGRENKWLGAFGAATITPRYETEPDPRVRYYCGRLALRSDGQDLFVKLPQLSSAVPYGAGICLRKVVAEAWEAKKRSSHGPMFGRKGTDLVSSEDLELSLMAVSCGYGYGIFASLTLIHLIPSRRVQLEYLLDLHEASTYSNDLLRRLYSQEQGRPPRKNLKEVAMLVGCALKIGEAKGIERRFEWRRARGLWRALREFRHLRSTMLTT
jgi:glycosyltransferase involved in cell wall biosynthesis